MAVIITLHEGALVLAALLSILTALLAWVLSRGARPGRRALVVMTVLFGTWALAYELSTRSLSLNGIEVEVVRLGPGAPE